MNARNKEYLELLKQSFNESKYIEFIKDLLNLDSSDINTDLSEKIITNKQYKDDIKNYKYIAKYNDGLNNIGIFIVNLKSTKARNLQRNFVASLLNNFGLDASIVAFYSDNDTSWRLSFVKKELSFSDKGVKESLTPAKRYSFLVGEHESVHTAQEFLFKLLEIDSRKITLEDIEKVFDVEKVAKKFFDEYVEKYLLLKKHLDNNEDFITESKKCDFTSEEFAKKLMGQIVFLYFLQKKGWLGVQLVPNELSVNEFNELLSSNDSVSQNLINMFYGLKEDKYIINKNELRQANNQDVINFTNIFVKTKYDKPWGTGAKDFIRNIYKQSRMEHRNFFDEYLEQFFYNGLNEKRENQYFTLFNCKIPFLNGGLFEPLNNYRWSSAHFSIPNDIFSNDNKDGILDFLDLYNFTIDEEEPLEKDVAVDPEMLGKIFENLLDVDDRKSKGAFYTPREIVYYMCQESLANYLVKKANLNYDEIIYFIRYGDLISHIDWERSLNDNNNFVIGKTIYNNLLAIDKALIDIKVADPSVGSGAFPLGILTEIIKIRNNITTYLLIQNDLGLININDLINTEHGKRDIFYMKLQTIENCIYAVDVETSAIDIAKLRLWLSLIVDYPNDEEPKPLPNLDCKIMQGNSLVDEYKGVPLFSEKIFKNSQRKNASKVQVQQNIFGDVADIHIQQSLQFDDNSIDLNYYIDTMLNLQKQYFSTSDNKLKKDLKEKIDSIQMGMVEETLKNDPSKLKQFKEDSKKRQKNWFIWKLEFYDVYKNNKGFDIVIGNPPYVGEDGNKKIFEPIKISNIGRKFYQGKMDLLYFFFHLGLDLLNDNGILSLITTNYYITADGAKKLRQDIKERSNIKKIINFNEKKVFDSAKGQHNMITILAKGKLKEDEICNIISFKNGGNLFSEDLRNMLNDELRLDDYVKVDISNQNLYYGKNNYLDIRNNFNSDSREQKIINYLSRCNLKLENVATLNQGLVSGANKVISTNLDKLGKDIDVMLNDGIFVMNLLNNRDINVISTFNDYEKTLLRPYFKNSDIQKYHCIKENTKMVLYIDRDENDINRIPNIYKHLEKFKSVLNQRRETLKGIVKFYQLQWPRNKEIFTNPKILLPYRSKSNDFAYCDIDWYFSTDCYCLINDNERYLKFLLGLLNSKTYYIWFKTMGKVKGDVLEFMPTMLNETPIIEMSNEDMNIIIDCVNTLISNTNIDIYTSSEYLTIEKIIEKYVLS